MGEGLVCTPCLAHLPYLSNQQQVAQKFYGKVHLTYAGAFLQFGKAGKVQSLIHQLKYRGQQEVGLWLGKMYGHQLVLQGFQEQIDVLLPVPIHPDKRKIRGYNQTDSIAQGLSEALGIAWNNEVLSKGTATQSQTRKGRLERFQNSEQVYGLQNSGAIKAKRIAIVDDVITTGATLEACAKVLLEAGAKEVSVLAIASVGD